MDTLLEQLQDWAAALPDKQKKLCQALVSHPKGRMPREIDLSLFRSLSVYSLARAFFRFVVPVGLTRAAGWMETPEPPWPRWSQKDPWNVCYYAGPEGDMYQDIGLVESGQKCFRIDERTCALFCRRLSYLSRRISPSAMKALRTLILQSMHPIQRMRLVDSDRVLSLSERRLVESLKRRFRSAKDPNKER